MQSQISSEKNIHFLKILTDVRKKVVFFAFFLPVIFFISQLSASCANWIGIRKSNIITLTNQVDLRLSSTPYSSEVKQQGNTGFPNDRHVYIAESEGREKEELLTEGLDEASQYFITFDNDLAPFSLNFNLLSEYFLSEGHTPGWFSHKIYLLIQVFRI